ncbi:MAG: hypothetical protein NTW66_02810 [Candidatus Magasanikbacteria bacterium]|nr:hypothetical protein [Candidatus Magasanikbacteria bacterium]
MPKQYPRVKFIIDRKRDMFALKLGDEYIKHCFPNNMRFVGGKDFSKKERLKLAKSFAENRYEKELNIFRSNLKVTERKWRKHEKIFFRLVDKIFKNYPWPKGNYRGYISAFYRFPRNISQKTFAFPAQYNNPRFVNFDLLVIAHEMLHFITYDYLQKKYHLKPSEHHNKDNFFWQFTENLNVLIENSKMWRPFSGKFVSGPYDKKAAELLASMEKIWRKNHDLDNLIVKTFKLKK